MFLLLLDSFLWGCLLKNLQLYQKMDPITQAMIQICFFGLRKSYTSKTSRPKWQKPWLCQTLLDVFCDRRETLKLKNAFKKSFKKKKKKLKKQTTSKNLGLWGLLLIFGSYLYLRLLPDLRLVERRALDLRIEDLDLSKNFFQGGA